MKRNVPFFIVLFSIASLLVSCVQNTSNSTRHNNDESRHVDWSYNATIYELNTRQVTEEGTFAAAELLLPALKENGVDIIWVMPCQPIGVITRKGTLGSYYSIKDYKDINPEFGTMEDFKHFLNAAHNLGFKVILDWVANHTAPDHAWTANYDWHVRDSLGNLVIQYDWTDIAKLNYNNVQMREAMKQTMKWWIDSVGIDGFRCDVAGEVPTDFWNEAMGELKKQHPNLFTLAEDEDKANELTETAFDMYYGWTLHSLMNKVAQGKATVSDLWAYFDKADTTIRKQAIRMNFITNHDENSWNGTEMERLGEACNLFAVFSYIVPGMPLIYTGQLSGNHHRLAFFEKDKIDIDPHYAMNDLYKSLNTLRKNNKALWSPEKGAEMQKIMCEDKSIFACVRQLANQNTVIAVFNMSAEMKTVSLPIQGLAGNYTSLEGEKVSLDTTATFTLNPWGYTVLEK